MLKKLVQRLRRPKKGKIELERVGSFTLIKRDGVPLAYCNLPIEIDNNDLITGKTQFIFPENIFSQTPQYISHGVAFRSGLEKRDH